MIELTLTVTFYNPSLEVSGTDESGNALTLAAVFSNPSLAATDTDVSSVSQTVEVVFGKVFKGDKGEGVPSGGTAGQVLRKKTNADYDTEWADGGSGSGGSWGEIGGTLSDQTDLQEALDAKAAKEGDETQTFKCAAATQASHAVNKTTMEAAIQQEVGNISALLETI